MPCLGPERLAFAAYFLKVWPLKNYLRTGHEKDETPAIWTAGKRKAGDVG
jgi:hypothetical protein